MLPVALFRHRIGYEPARIYRNPDARRRRSIQNTVPDDGDVGRPPSAKTHSPRGLAHESRACYRIVAVYHRNVKLDEVVGPVVHGEEILLRAILRQGEGRLGVRDVERGVARILRNRDGFPVRIDLVALAEVVASRVAISYHIAGESLVADVEAREIQTSFIPRDFGMGISAGFDQVQVDGAHNALHFLFSRCSVNRGLEEHPRQSNRHNRATPPLAVVHKAHFRCRFLGCQCERWRGPLPNLWLYYVVSMRRDCRLLEHNLLPRVLWDFSGDHEPGHWDLGPDFSQEPIRIRGPRIDLQRFPVLHDVVQEKAPDV
mmetsp:Transcript_11133/g.27355  ORF Transcript_11133/g.27355 Transcript_11133/m.27355 type:complete len:316 (+) Transcript_11133:1757-2704(+)